jgi:hypothetical protein
MRRWVARLRNGRPDCRPSSVLGQNAGAIILPTCLTSEASGPARSWKEWNAPSRVQNDSCRISLRILPKMRSARSDARAHPSGGWFSQGFQPLLRDPGPSMPTGFSLSGLLETGVFPNNCREQGLSPPISECDDPRIGGDERIYRHLSAPERLRPPADA